MIKRKAKKSNMTNGFLRFNGFSFHLGLEISLFKNTALNFAIRGIMILPKINGINIEPGDQCTNPVFVGIMIFSKQPNRIIPDFTLPTVFRF